MGAVTTKFLEVTPHTWEALSKLPHEQIMRYVITPIGMAIVKWISTHMGLLRPEMQAIVAKLGEAGIVSMLGGTGAAPPA